MDHDEGLQLLSMVIMGIAVFLISAIVESFITMWMFKKFGGCPMDLSKKKQ